MKRKFLTTLFVFLLTICMALGIAACNTESEGGVKITLNPATLSLNMEGSTGMVTATVSGSKEFVSWEIEDPAVASIIPMSNTCMVTPVSEGSTSLTASLGDVSAVCTVTVGPKAVVEEVTIYLDGKDVTDTNLKVEEGGTLVLTAEGSLGSSIKWSTDNEGVATVENGTVTAHRPGNAVITAFVTPSIKATVNVEVTAPEGTVYYDLLFGWGGNPEYREPENETNNDMEHTKIPDNTFYYWASRSGWYQQVDVEYAYYRNGTVSIKYTSDWDPGNWVGFQLHYINTNLTAGKDYRFTCKFTVDQDCFVTIAGVVYELKSGENDVTVYFKAGSTKFTIITGYDTHDNTNGYFVKDLEMSIGNMDWKEVTAVQLESPSFTYDAATGKIAITDPNTAGVGGYQLNFYDDGDVLRSVVEVKNGEAVDVSRVPNGTYTVRLVAVAENAGYVNSAPSTTSATITVNNASVHYELAATGAGGAIANPGTWTYYKSTWVNPFSATYTDGVVTFEFANNSGNWDDTQLYYLEPSAEAGKYYTFELTINSNAAGHIIISGQEIEIKEGTHVYTFERFHQTAGNATVSMIFALFGQSGGAQEIQEARMEISLTSFVEVEAPVIPEGSMPNGEEGVAAANPGKMYYWNDQNWCGSNVSVEAATEANGVYTLTYSNASTACWFGMQLFFKATGNSAGLSYTVTFKLNASVAGNITVNGEVKALVAGENLISVTYTEGTGASLSIQFGVKDPNGGDTFKAESIIAAGTFVLSDLEFTLVGGGEQGGNQGGTTPDTPKGEPVYIPTEANGNVAFGENNKVADNVISSPNKMYYWNDQNWCGSNVTVSEAKVENGVYIFTYSGMTTACSFGFQLFYKASNHIAGNSYTLQLKINASAAGDIRVNGAVKSLVVGDNAIEVTYVETELASISIQFGVETPLSVIAAGTFKLSEIAFIGAVSGSGNQESGNQGGGNQGGSTVEPSDVNVTLELDSIYGGENEYFFFWATTEADIASATRVTVNGTNVDWTEYSPADGLGRIPFRVKVGNTALASYTFQWFDASGNVIATAVYNA